MNSTITEIYGRLILGVFVAAVLLAIARAAFAGPAVVTPATAIEQAVARRLGSDVAVTVTTIETTVKAESGLQARPEPGARVGQAVRFVLTAGTQRRGVAVATVKVSGPHARAAHDIARDKALEADDVEVIDGDWPSVSFTRLPAEQELVGLTARRNIAKGEPLTSVALDVPPLVHAGDAVTMTARVGAVEATGAATASSSGHRGDIIRVTPRQGRSVRARVTGEKAVEVVQ